MHNTRATDHFLTDSLTRPEFITVRIAAKHVPRGKCAKNSQGGHFSHNFDQLWTANTPVLHWNLRYCLRKILKEPSAALNIEYSRKLRSTHGVDRISMFSARERASASPVQSSETIFSENIDSLARVLQGQAPTFLIAFPEFCQHAGQDSSKYFALRRFQSHRTCLTRYLCRSDQAN